MTRNWQQYGDCGDDPELFFPVSEISAPGLLQIAEAKRICRRCPVLRECRAEILEREGGAKADSRDGIVAGLTDKERHATYRRITRARETAAA